MGRGILPVEYLVGGAAFVALFLYRHFGIPLRQPLELYTERVCGGFAWYGLALVLSLFFLRLAHLRSEKRHSLSETWLRYRKDFLSPRRIFFDLRIVHALGLMFAVFIQLKHLTPTVTSRLLDRYLLDSEAIVFGGKLVSERLIRLVGTAPAPVLSSAYTAFFPYMGLLLALMVLQRDALLASRFALGFASVWLAGIALIYLVPTWGPCFFRPALFDSLPRTEMSTLQAELWRGKLFSEARPHSPAGVFLISGFPSLHLAVAAFGSLALGLRSRALGRLSWAFFWVTGLTTLYFGWHYLLDDIGGFLLGTSIFRRTVTPRERERLIPKRME